MVSDLPVGRVCGVDGSAGSVLLHAVSCHLCFPENQVGHPALILASKALEKTRLRKIEGQCQNLSRNLIGKNYVAVAGEQSQLTGSVWLVLLDVNVGELEERRRQEVQTQLARLLPLLDFPASTPARDPGDGKLLPDSRLTAWTSWFRDLPEAEPLPKPSAFHSTEFNLGSWRTWALVMIVLVSVFSAAELVAASGSPLLKVVFYFFRVALAGLLIVASLSLGFLADWVGQPRTLALCYSVAFLCWRISTMATSYRLDAARNALVCAAALGAFALGSAALSARFSDSVVRSLLFNATCGILGAILLVSLMFPASF